MGKQNELISLVIIFLFLFNSTPGVVWASMDEWVGWSKTYGGSNMDASVSLIEASDGGYVLAGFTRPNDRGSSDALLIKTDRFGDLEWNKTIGDEDNYSASSVIQTSDGGFAFIGTNASYYEGYIPVGSMPEGTWSYYWLVKTDQNGNVEWSRTFDTEAGYYYGSCLVQTIDLGFILVGHYFFESDEDTDLFMIKTDSFGNLQWSKSYGELGRESDPYFVKTIGGGYAIACKQYPYDDFYVDVLVIKTDEFGNMEWSNTFGGERMDYPTSIVELSDENFVIAGCTDSYGNGGYDFWLIKTDNFGTLEWNITYGTNNMETNPSLVQTFDGGFALAGNSHYDSFADLLLIKTDAYGNIQWNQTYSGKAAMCLTSLIETSDGGFGLSGSIGDWDSEDFDFWLIKTDNRGIIPEFPSWLILPLFLIATLIVTGYRKKMKTSSKCL